MKVFYELTHTACDCAIMRNHHSYDVMYPTWDESGRPKPKNVRLVGAPEGQYDLAVVGFERGFGLMRNLHVPIIWKSMVDFGSWPPPRPDIMDRVSAWVALCEEGIVRYGLTGHPKASYIVPGIDSDVFGGYVGGEARVLSIGNLLPARPEKGPDLLARVAAKAPVDTVGIQNEGLPNVRVLPVASSLENLASIYRKYRVYFNPCGVVCCALLEAMATGMAVVTMRPHNFIPMMEHRENCFIADTEEEAVGHIELLLKNGGIARDVGKRARETVQYQFHPALVGDRWGRLMERVVEEFKTGRK